MSFEVATQIYLNIPHIVSNWCEKSNDKALIFAAQFGSSLSSLPKYTSDFDIFLCYTSLPRERNKMWALTDALDEELEPYFKKLQNYGLFYHFSPILRDAQGLSRFSYFYLDLPEHSQLLFGSHEAWQAFLQRIVTFRERISARKRYDGTQTVWDLTGACNSQVKF